MSFGTLGDPKNRELTDMTSPSRPQSLTPDGLGNFSSATTNPVIPTRIHNKENQVTALCGANLIQDEQSPSRKCGAWNRFVGFVAILLHLLFMVP